MVVDYSLLVEELKVKKNAVILENALSKMLERM